MFTGIGIPTVVLGPGSIAQAHKPDEYISHDQIAEAYRRARDLGVKRFGLHTMLVSNERNYRYMVQTARMLLELAVERDGRRWDLREAQRRIRVWKTGDPEEMQDPRTAHWDWILDFRCRVESLLD